MKDLSNTLREELTKKGANLVGFADLQGIEEHKRESMRFGVSVAVALSPDIIKGIKDGPTLEYYNEYNRINDLLDGIIAYATDLIKDHGFNAIPKLRKNVKIDEKTQSTILPHKTVATRAGLG